MKKNFEAVERYRRSMIIHTDIHSLNSVLVYQLNYRRLNQQVSTNLEGTDRLCISERVNTNDEYMACQLVIHKLILHLLEDLLKQLSS